MLRIIVAASAILLSFPAFSQPVVVPHEFVAWEQGGFLSKTIPQLNTPQFKAMLTASCAALAVDCSTVADAIARGAYYATPYVSNSNLQTTAWVDWHRGEEYAAKFAAPSGWTTCKAIIDVGHGSITGGATFNGSIQRMSGPNNDGIGLYVVVPKNRPSGQWVQFQVDVEFVPREQPIKTVAGPTIRSCSSAPGRIAIPIRVRGDNFLEKVSNAAIFVTAIAGRYVKATGVRSHMRHHTPTDDPARAARLIARRRRDGRCDCCLRVLPDTKPGRFHMAGK